MKAPQAKTFVDNKSWWPDWRGETCVIVASGPSAKNADLIAVRDKAKVVVINTSWHLAPWADVLYGCDFKWWQANADVHDGFGGLKISQDRKCASKYPNIKLIECDRIEGKTKLILQPKGTVGWGGNGGFQTINLVAQFGVKKIILVGFDMRLDKGLHWHGQHMNGLNNPRHHNVERWREAIDGIAQTLLALGIEVMNVSEISALKAYPKMTLYNALLGSTNG